ncbi:Ankyrin repeat and SOCS box protein 11 [Bulinus truncatus]|nr:Ankyrin repeat and SOCS box protein 11 [Bulinus truncatus]
MQILFSYLYYIIIIKIVQTCNWISKSIFISNFFSTCFFFNHQKIAQFVMLVANVSCKVQPGRNLISQGLLLLYTSLATESVKMADGDRVLLEIQAELQRVDRTNRTISTLAKQGNDELVQDFLTEKFKIQSAGPLARVSQLYIASFWGLKDSVQKLLEAGTDPNFQNEETLWTPLHAATFQEHGPIIMMLLEYGAQPELPDAQDRTAADFASASDTVWPLFAALNIPRTPRSDLIKKQILRPGSGMKDQRENISLDFKTASDNDGRSNNYNAALSGDVLANEHEDLLPVDPRYGTEPKFTIWK